MPALNFQKRFAEAVETGEKRQTIRARRRDDRQPCKVGDLLTLYTGMRSKSCRKLLVATCVHVRPLFISADTRLVFWAEVTGGFWRRKWLLAEREIEELWRADGFNSADAFYDFFYKSGAHFWLIQWAAPSEKRDDG